MKQITESYVSFETAKLLKEKGFPQDYDRYHGLVYNEEDYEDEYEVQRMVLETRQVKAGTLHSYPLGVPEPKCYCPSQSLALKWLREVHNIYITLHPNTFYCDGKCSSWNFSIWCMDNLEIDGSEYNKNAHDSYEKAVEAALKYTLKNLI